MQLNLKELKKRVSREWQNAFPQLTPYTDNKLYKVIGPVIVGIELINLPNKEEYRPHFVMYSLWGNRTGNNLKACLNFPILLKEFYTDKGIQYCIPYVESDMMFSDIINTSY